MTKAFSSLRKRCDRCNKLGATRRRGGDQNWDYQGNPEAAYFRAEDLVKGLDVRFFEGDYERFRFANAATLTFWEGEEYRNAGEDDYYLCDKCFEESPFRWYRWDT